MAIHLELENGSIKKYPTSYKIYYSKGENSLFDIKSKCNISNKCDHLDCAIYAAEYTAKNNKNHFKLCIFIFKRNTPQLAAAGIKGMRIQFRLRSAWPGSNFMRQRLGCPAACGVGALPPFHLHILVCSSHFRYRARRGLGRIICFIWDL